MNIHQHLKDGRKGMHIRKDVLKLTAPIMLEQTFIMLMGVINAIMAGRIGKETVSAIGMVDSLNNIFIAFFSALAVGGTVIVAYYDGRGNTRDSNESAKQAIYSGLAISIAVTLLIWLFRRPLMSLLFGTAEKTVFENAIIYLNITLLTYPLIALTSIACGVIRGAGDTKTPMKVTIFMNVINVLLSYIFIYGINLGSGRFAIHLPSLGIRGAAYAIAAARTIGAATIMLVLIRGTKTLKLDSFKNIKINMDMQKSIFGIGIPASVESLMFNGGKLITQIFIVGMGTAAIAANYVAGSVSGLVNIPGNALTIAATTLVGQAMGRRQTGEAGDLMMYLTKLSSIFLFIPCLLMFPFGRAFASLYTQSSDVVSIAVQLIRLSAITTPIFWSLSFLLPAGLKAAGDAKYTMVTSIIGMWAFRITLGYILGIPLKMGVVGVWCGMYIDWIVRGILYYARLKKGKWKNNTVISKMDFTIEQEA